MDAFFHSGVWVPTSGLGFLIVQQLLSQSGDLASPGAHPGLVLVLLVCYLPLTAPAGFQSPVASVCLELAGTVLCPDVAPSYSQHVFRCCPGWALTGPTRAPSRTFPSPIGAAAHSPPHAEALRLFQPRSSWLEPVAPGLLSPAGGSSWLLFMAPRAWMVAIRHSLLGLLSGSSSQALGEQGIA